MLVQRGAKLLSLLYETRDFLRSMNNMYLNLSSCDKKPQPNERHTPQVIASKPAEFLLIVDETRGGNLVFRLEWSASFDAEEINGAVHSVSISRQPNGKEEIARRVLNKPLEVTKDATLKPHYALEVEFDGINFVIVQKR